MRAIVSLCPACTIIGGLKAFCTTVVPFVVCLSVVRALHGYTGRHCYGRRHRRTTEAGLTMERSAKDEDGDQKLEVTGSNLCT